LAAAVIAPPFEDLSALSHRRLAAMRRASNDFFEVLESFSDAGRHPVRDILAASPDPYTRWSRYPPGDVEDPRTGCAWYYHAHDPSESRPWEEHGHFHFFLFAELIAKNAKPIALPADPDHEMGGLVHVAGLSFDAIGIPNRLFTINRWASNEWMYPARNITPLIDRFQFESENEFILTSRWLSAILRLLYPQLAWALRERDRVIAEHREAGSEGFTEDQSVDVISSVTFDVDDHLAALDRAWQWKFGRGQM
jgi:hypothetical protein